MLGTYCFKIQILVYRIYEYNILFMLKEPVKEKAQGRSQQKVSLILMISLDFKSLKYALG